MAPGGTDDVDVGGTRALLACGGTRETKIAETKEDRLELNHAGRRQ
jgi:hypothetical protein